MPPSRIIRIPRTDEDGAFILGEVTPSGSSGKPLNLKFIATEGEEPYVVKLRHDRIADLRSTTSTCSPDEWERILKTLFLNEPPMEGIEFGAEAHTGRSLTITVRRRVAGINQRLGTITLTHHPSEAIQLFDWCISALSDRETLQSSLTSANAQLVDLESRISSLRAQLEELVEAKKARENELLEKFCVLLNEKKVKIREQQRLLASANPPSGEGRLAAARASFRRIESPVKGRRPGPSRKAKRKALEDASGGGTSDGEDGEEGFETMAKPVGRRGVARPVSVASTPSEEDDDEGDRMDVDPPLRASQARKRGSAESDEDRHTTDHENEEGEQTADSADEDHLVKGKAKGKAVEKEVEDATDSELEDDPSPPSPPRTRKQQQQQQQQQQKKKKKNKNKPEPSKPATQTSTTLQDEDDPTSTGSEGEDESAPVLPRRSEPLSRPSASRAAPAPSSSQITKNVEVFPRRTLRSAGPVPEESETESDDEL